MNDTTRSLNLKRCKTVQHPGGWSLLFARSINPIWPRVHPVVYATKEAAEAKAKWFNEGKDLEVFQQ